MTKLTEKQELFLQVLFDEAGGDLRTAMRIAGYSDNTPVSYIANQLSDEIYEATKKYIARSATAAAFEMGAILSGKSQLIGMKERMAAAKDILDRAGLSKTEKVEVVAKDPLFILPPKNKEEDD